MERFLADDFARVVSDLAMVETAIQHRMKTEPGAAQILVNGEFIADITRDVRRAAVACGKYVEMHPAATVAQQCILDLHEPGRMFSLGEVELLLRNLRLAIRRQLTKQYLITVPTSRADSIDNDKLLGDEVSVAFPDAAVDIRAAGNCSALDLHTAAVFHLMRVTEYGLRWLAKRLKVTLTHKGKRTPVEYADWNKVITAIKNKLSAVRQHPPGSKRQTQLDAYSRAADQCEYFKDIWRNEVSHARRHYSAPEAEVVLVHVRDFMMSLTRMQK